MKTDVSKIQVQVTNLNTQKHTLVNSLNHTKSLLKLIAGIDKEEEIEFVMPQYNVDSVEAGSDTGEPGMIVDIALLEKQVELSHRKLKSIQAEYYPELAAFGQFGYNNNQDEFSVTGDNGKWFYSSVIGVKLTIPVFNGFNKSSRARQEKLKIEQAKIDLEYNKKLIATNISNAQNTLENNYEALMAQKENKVLATEVFEKTNLQYVEGVGTINDVLDAETSLREANDQYLIHMFKYKMSELDLRKAKGLILKGSY